MFSRLTVKYCLLLVKAFFLCQSQSQNEGFKQIYFAVNLQPNFGPGLTSAETPQCVFAVADALAWLRGTEVHEFCTISSVYEKQTSKNAGLPSEG